MSDKTFEVQFETKAEYETAVQTAVDKTVGERLSRERKTIATKLGIESYEKLDEYIITSKQGKTVRDTLQTENSTLKTEGANKDLTIDMLKADVHPDQMDNAKALVKVKQGANEELLFADGLTALLEEMPFLLKSVDTGDIQPPKQKVGVVVNNTPDTRTDTQKYMDENYKGSKYYKTS